jgi:hypothetical protein
MARLRKPTDNLHGCQLWIFWGGDTAFSPGLLSPGEGLDSSVTRSLKEPKGTLPGQAHATFKYSTLYGVLTPSTHTVVSFQ